MSTELGKAYVQIIPSAEGIKDGITEALGGEPERAGKSAGFKLAGAIKGAIAAAGIGAALKDALMTGAAFDATMSEVAAISGATGAEFDALREKAQEMGASTKFSASESAEALTYMAMAGWKTEDMLGGIEGIMKLAAASGESLALTSDIVTDALTAFGMAADDAGHFADILAAASSNANTNVAMLGESFKYVAPVAGAMGYSAEDASVALGLMANSGIKASQAGTALRTLLSNMADPGKSAAAAMDNLGVSLTNSEGEMYSLMEIMQTLRGSFAELTDAEAAEQASLLAGKEGMSGLLAVVNASDEDFRKLTESIYGADGAAGKMADTMQDNLAGDVTILKSAFEGLQISLSDKLSPALREIVQGLTAAIDNFDTVGPIIAGVAVAIGGLAVAINIGAIIQKTTAAFAAFNAVLAANPVGIVIAALAGLATALVLLWKNNEEFRNKVTAAWEAVKTAALNLKTNIENAFNGIRDKIVEIKDAALTWGKDLIANFVNGIKKGWDTLKGTLGKFAQLVADFIGFSEPKKGPLSNFHTYAPDMMQLFVKGILDNKGRVKDAMRDIAALTASGYETEIAVNASAGSWSKSVPNGSGSGSSGAVVNFTQNNYSPKALSRTEIYRQTNNQFAMLRGAAT